MIKKKPITETEIDVGYVMRKPQRLHERFLKGPIPIRNIARASKLSGQSLSVYLAVHHQTALTRKSLVTLPKGLLMQLGVSRDAKSRALKQLHNAGLVRLENHTGRAARVALMDKHDTGLTTATGTSANEQWVVVDDGIRCQQQEYVIPKSQLVELREAAGAGIAMWPLQMAEKSWVNIDAFIAAFDHALEVHKPDGAEKVDRMASYSKARQIGANRK